MSNTLSLTPSQWQTRADSLGLDVCLLKAVAEVESSGNGFLPDGRVVVRFEKHVFLRELKKRDAPQNALDVAARFTGTSWETLDAAAALDKEAALCSASWGAFQIMGFNFAACGFADVHAFVAAMRQGPEEQLKAFAAFLQSQKLVDALKGKNWAGFAERYNGRAYAKNHYDEKLAEAYERCRQTTPPDGPKAKPADPETDHQPRRVKIDPLPDAAARPIGE